MIKAEGIEKSYNGEKVLKGVNLEISDGEFVAVMGESGSGKSTLISILGGFLAADSGRVLWNGEDISKFSETLDTEATKLSKLTSNLEKHLWKFLGISVGAATLLSTLVSVLLQLWLR